MPEYLGELLFDEWAKKTNMDKTMGDKNDADKLMAETEKAMEMEEETASSNTAGHFKANAKGKEKMEE
jgi:hypothetical protein